MQFNYDFEIASLIIMIIILLHFICIRQFPGEKTRCFRMLLFSCTAECGANILSSIGLANAALVPEAVNGVLAFAFFVLQGLSSYLIYRYVVAVCAYSSSGAKRARIIGLVPFVIFELLVVTTPLTGFLYYFKGGSYHRGVGSVVGYLYIVCFFVLNIVSVVLRRAVINFRTKVIMASYTAVAITMVVVQYLDGEILLASVGNMIIVVMLYLEMQNPSDMLDPVAGIGNERAFQLQLQNIFSGKTYAAVMTIHLRKFYYIHTVVGMENSNELLHEVGAYLYRLCGKFHVFHLYGDSFTVLVDEPENLAPIQSQISERFKQEWTVRQNRIVLNMDMVIQHYPEDFDSVPSYMGMQQFLIERASASGTQAVVIADAEAVLEYYRRRKIELAVLRAIRERRFEVYYQPLYSIREKRIVSLEALVRLWDEELGFIPPDEFIPLAERDGNIVYIGAQVLEECCRFLAKHVLSNDSLGIKTIHINISMAQCLRENLTDIIVPVLEQHHIPPSMITLEITERMAINSPEHMQHHMEELGRMGVSFAMDDYGTGNSNCASLIKLPFREIKIDKEIVWEAFKSETARVVLESEIRTIQKLGIPLVIEGIEEKEQSEAMEKLGVDFIQGYYYGKPLPEKECLRHIRKFNADSEDYARQQSQADADEKI